MKLELLIPLFTTVQNMFRDTMKGLFVNEYLCEETSLYFFVIEIMDRSKTACFINEQLKIEDVEVKGRKTCDELIEGFLSNKFRNRGYIIEESDNISIGGREIRIFWTLFSECLDSNSGRFLLRCVFERLVVDFNKCLINFNSSDERDVLMTKEQYVLTRYLVQKVLQDATEKTRMYLQKLYTPLNLPFIAELSGEYYEKAECQSTMIFIFQQTVNSMKRTDFLYCLDNMKYDGIELKEIEFVSSQTRLIRKLLQIAQQDVCLVLGENENKNTFKVLGFCNKAFFLERRQTFPYIMIRFRNHMHWDMLENQTYIFTYKNGQYKIERRIHEQYLNKKLNEYFSEQEAGYRILINNIMNVIQQEHGTMLIILNERNASDEVKRLGELCYGLPAALPEIRTDEVKCLSNIDGSVIIDTSGKIHGIGMILDGAAEVQGNLARGARYNSAVKYREYLKANNIKALILIISEDGSVDIMSG